MSSLHSHRRSSSWRFHLKQCLLAGLATLTGLGLTACSHHRTPQDAVGWQNGGSDDAPLTYGAQPSDSFAQETSTTSTRQAFNANYPVKAGNNLTVYFAFDNDQVTQRAYDALVAQAEYLRDHPQAHVRLEGNTDERGSSEYNMALGWRRASAVTHFLVAHGAQAQQVSEMSYGEEHPVAYEHNAHAWQINRRVDLVYENLGT